MARVIGFFFFFFFFFFKWENTVTGQDGDKRIPYCTLAQGAARRYY
jgi:hypothetical protein